MTIGDVWEPLDKETKDLIDGIIGGIFSDEQLAKMSSNEKRLSFIFCMTRLTQDFMLSKGFKNE